MAKGDATIQMNTIGDTHSVSACQVGLITPAAVGAPGIFEFRVRYDAATILRERGLPVPANLDTSHQTILLRVFCHAHGEKVILLLAAYDKGKESSAKRQNAEIKRAKQRLARWKGSQTTGKP